MKQHDPRFVQLVEQSKSRIREITLDQVLQALSGSTPPLFIDVREDHEWTRGQIPGAVHLGKGILERDIGKICPDTDQPIVLYCGGGYRSALAADALQQMGYSHVRSLAGGYRAWSERAG